MSAGGAAGRRLVSLCVTHCRTSQRVRTAAPLLVSLGAAESSGLWGHSFTESVTQTDRGRELNPELKTEMKTKSPETSPP